MSSQWVQKLNEDFNMNIEKARQENRRRKQRREPRVQMFSAVADGDAKGDNNAILLIGAFVLAIAIVGIVFIKNQAAVGTPAYTPMQGYISQEQHYLQQYQKASPQYNVEDLYNRYEKYDENAKSFWENQTWTQDRLALLAIVVNHNTEVERLSRPKSELVVLHQDWTLSGFPYLVKMTPEDEAFVQQFLR